MEDQAKPMLHVEPDGSVFEVRDGGELVPLSVAEGQAIREKLSEAEREMARRHAQDLEHLSRMRSYLRQAKLQEDQ